MDRHFPTESAWGLASTRGERFAGVNGGKSKQSFLQSYHSLNDLEALEPFVKAFFKIYPHACSQLLATEDKKWERPFSAQAYC